ARERFDRWLRGQLRSCSGWCADCPRRRQALAPGGVVAAVRSCGRANEAVSGNREFGRCAAREPVPAVGSPDARQVPAIDSLVTRREGRAKAEAGVSRQDSTYPDAGPSVPGTLRIARDAR